MSRLTPCFSCRRHVKRTEAACPFCAAPLSTTDAAPPAARPAPGINRAALFAMGMSLAASACEADNSVPIYGAPNVPQAGSSGSGGAAGSSGSGGSAAGTGGGPITSGPDEADAAAPDAAPPDAETDAGDSGAAP